MKQTLAPRILHELKIDFQMAVELRREHTKNAPLEQIDELPWRSCETAIYARLESSLGEPGESIDLRHHFLTRVNISVHREHTKTRAIC